MAVSLIGLGHKGLNRGLCDLKLGASPQTYCCGKMLGTTDKLTTGAWSGRLWYGHVVKFQNDAVEIYFLE